MNQSLKIHDMFGFNLVIALKMLEKQAYKIIATL